MTHCPYATYAAFACLLQNLIHLRHGCYVPMQEASETYLSGILGFEEQPLVSTDYVNDPRSSIVDAACTQVRLCVIHVQCFPTTLPRQ